MELNRELSGEKKKSIFLFCYAITIKVLSRNRLFVPVDHLQCCCCCRTTLVVQVHASLCVQAERTVTAVNMSF